MKNILLRLGVIAIAVGALAAGSTGAFFSDTETSSNNTFAAGAIDLKIDNSSYYNGVATSTTSWSLADLTIQKFFNFFDLKPGDYGEDTISLHIDSNDAYLCASVALTSNDDNGLNEPEAQVDTTGGVGEGELASNVNFIMWPDDGDNVLETGETVLYNGPIGAVGVGSTTTIPLADSATNIWTGVGGPAPGNVTQYVGKAWCFGNISLANVTQDNVGNVRTPAGNNNGNGVSGEPEDGGYHCDGSQLNNSTQTDSLTADITFTATQARNNPGFLCTPTARGATLTLVKSVNNGSVGNASTTDWTLTASGPTNLSGLSGTPQVTNASVTVGGYVLGETGGVPGYGATQYSCVVNGGAAVVGNNLNLASGDVATCTVVNAVNACSAGQQWADAVVGANQGVRKDGTLILADRRNPATALGAPQTTGTPSDAVVTPNSFFSLGFNVGTTTTRSLTVSFNNNVILNGPGNDLTLYEVTGGVYPDEHVMVEASKDGISWTTVAADVIRDANIDLGALNWARYVRVTDINLTGPFPTDADGYDVDAIGALNCAQLPQ